MRRSPKPRHLAEGREAWYWHAAQDIAFRAEAAVEERDGASWLVDDAGEHLLCTPIDRRRIWYETWLALQGRYPALSRPWTRYRP